MQTIDGPDADPRLIVALEAMRQELTQRGLHNCADSCCSSHDADHIAHALEVRNSWLASAVAEAEAQDLESGLHDTKALPPLFKQGDRIRVTSLRSRPELNGAVGNLLKRDASSGRWGVRLEDGELLRVRPENLTPAPPDDHAGRSRVLHEDMDLILHILGFLPPASLLCCAQVCRRWRPIARDDSLWREWCRRQRADKVPRAHWPRLTLQVEAALIAAPGWAGWASEYERAERDAERDSGPGTPVWSDGEDSSDGEEELGAEEVLAWSDGDDSFEAVEAEAVEAEPMLPHGIPHEPEEAQSLLESVEQYEF
jgi:hypothetical protein